MIRMNWMMAVAVAAVLGTLAGDAEAFGGKRRGGRSGCGGQSSCGRTVAVASTGCSSCCTVAVASTGCSSCCTVAVASTGCSSTCGGSAVVVGGGYVGGGYVAGGSYYGGVGVGVGRPARPAVRVGVVTRPARTARR